jgi:hypothetical protein
MDNYVYALTTYDDALIAGGSFGNAGGVAADNIAQWDGMSWGPVGSGVEATVDALIVFNGDLVAGGNFNMAGEITAFSIARWNGSAWSPFGSGLSSRPRAFAEYEGDLYAGGYFKRAGGKYSYHIAKWTEPNVAVPDAASLADGSIVQLLGCEPNPFRNATRIGCNLSRDSDVRLAVFDPAGRCVRRLIQGTRSAGDHRVMWNGTDHAGARVASGVYFIRIEAGSDALSQPLILIR